MFNSLSTPLAAGIVVLASYGTIAVTNQDSTEPHRSEAAVATPLFSFTDETFDDAEWNDQIIQDLNDGTPAGFTAFQDNALGLLMPSRQVDHYYTCSATTATGMADASWSTKSAFDPGGETVEFISFRFDMWMIKGVAVHPLILQNGVFYAGPKVIPATREQWEAYYRAKLYASDFVVRDDFSPPGNPDFSQPMEFGYVTANSAPAVVDCPRLVQAATWIDNFQVSVNESIPLPANQPPEAVTDLMVARTLIVPPFNNLAAQGALNVLYNDSDPDGDPLSIVGVTPPSGGASIVHPSNFGPGYIEYLWPVVTSLSDVFTYTVSDAVLDAVGKVTVLMDCGCIVECYALPGKHEHTSTSEAIDLTFIRRFRDEAMETTEFGAEYVDLYYHSMPEILKILMLDNPALGAQAVEMVELLQPVLRNLLDGDGTMPFTQEQMDAIDQFASDLSIVASDSLAQRISDELTRLGPLADYVNVPVSSALATVLGNPINVSVDEPETLERPTGFVLEQNYPNPFNPETTILYEVPTASKVSLQVYDVLGKLVATLVDSQLSAASHEVSWDASGLPTGLYFYTLRAGDFTETKTMIFVK